MQRLQRALVTVRCSLFGSLSRSWVVILRLGRSGLGSADWIAPMCSNSGVVIFCGHLMPLLDALVAVFGLLLCGLVDDIAKVVDSDAILPFGRMGFKMF